MVVTDAGRAHKLYSEHQALNLLNEELYFLTVFKLLLACAIEGSLDASSRKDGFSNESISFQNEKLNLF